MWYVIILALCIGNDMYAMNEPNSLNIDSGSDSAIKMAVACYKTAIEQKGGENTDGADATLLYQNCLKDLEQSAIQDENGTQSITASSAHNQKSPIIDSIINADNVVIVHALGNALICIDKQAGGCGLRYAINGARRHFTTCSVKVSPEGYEIEAADANESRWGWILSKDGMTHSGLFEISTPNGIR